MKNMEAAARPGKNELRKLIKEKRTCIGIRQKSVWDQAVFEKLTAHPAIAGAGCVYCYMSIGQETGTHKLLQWLWEREKAAAVPRVEGKSMSFYLVRSPEDLEPGCMKILEPKSWCFQAEYPKAPVIVPGLAFAPAGERYGYGGGYYDKFFQREPLHYRIGIAYDFQVLPRLKQEPYDQTVDEIITPDHHYICKEELL